MPYYLIRPTQTQPWNLGAIAQGKSRDSAKRLIKGSHLDLRDVRIEEIPFETVKLVLDEQDLNTLKLSKVVPLPNQEDYMRRWTKNKDTGEWEEI